MKKSFGLAIPMLNAASELPQLLQAIRSQSLQPTRFLVIDSSSTDDTVALCREAGAEVIVIRREEFDHGRTRQRAIDEMSDLPVVIFLTQDAVPADPNAFKNLLRAFEDETVAMAYGRQLPRTGAGAIEAHARLFNYPDVDTVDGPETLKERGVRAAFCSNSFSAYRVAALNEVGGFPANCIFGEDALVATQLMIQGWKKSYVASAQVQHSHDYRYAQEFRRYFDIGVMHAANERLWRNVGSAAGEGRKFVASELKYLVRNKPSAAPSAVARTVLKLAGYRAGRMYRIWPRTLIERLSMHRSYWRRAEAN